MANNDLFAPVTKEEIAFTAPPQQQAGPSIPSTMFAPVSDQELQSTIARQIEVPPEQDLRGRALRVGIERGGSLGLRPTIAGVAGAAGALTGSLQADTGIVEAAKASKDAFFEARNEAIEEQDVLFKEEPGFSAAGTLLGSAATLPLVAGRGLVGALKGGAALGAGEAAGTARSLEEAEDIFGTGLLVSGATFGIGKGVVKGTGALGRAVGKLDTVKAIKEGLRKGTRKIQSVVTGVGEADIERFAAQTDEMNKLIKVVGGDFQEATNIAKDKLAMEIKNARLRFGKQLGDAIEEASPERNISIKNVIEKIRNRSKNINRELNPDAINEIETALGKISSVADENGMVNLRQMQDVKDFLADSAKSAFRKQGQFFEPSNETKRALRAGFSEARSVLAEASPAIKQANAKLARLHGIEEQINKSLVKVGAPEGSFLAAGTGLNKRNERALRELGKIVDYDILGEAQKLATARQFTSPGLLPQSATGRSFTMLAAGGAVGGLVAGAAGGSPEKGALIGAALSSPAALKALLNTQNISRKVVKGAIEFLDSKEVRGVLAQELARQGITRNRLKKRLQQGLKEFK